MLDFALLNTCDHRFIEEIDIEGISPDYYASLTYEANPNLSTIAIIDANKSSITAIYAMNNSTGEGISNFYLDASNKVIVFGRYPVDAGMNFPDPNIDHMPADKYFCAYLVKTSECPKCSGSKIVKDIFIDNTGRIATVSGTEKLRQQIQKILLTLSGNNLYDTSYGSTLQSVIGQKINKYQAAQLQFTILDSLNHLQSIQYANNVPSNEQIKSISQIDAIRDSVDPRQINIYITVLTASYEEVTTSIKMQT